MFLMNKDHCFDLNILCFQSLFAIDFRISKTFNWSQKNSYVVQRFNCSRRHLQTAKHTFHRIFCCFGGYFKSSVLQSDKTTLWRCRNVCFKGPHVVNNMLASSLIRTHMYCEKAAKYDLIHLQCMLASWNNVRSICIRVTWYYFVAANNGVNFTSLMCNIWHAYPKDFFVSKCYLHF